MTPSVDDVLSKIVQAATVDELWRTRLLSMEAYGFQRVMYGLTRFPTGLISGDPKDFFILTSFAKTTCPDLLNPNCSLTPLCYAGPWKMLVRKAGITYRTSKIKVC